MREVTFGRQQREILRRPRKERLQERHTAPRPQLLVRRGGKPEAPGASVDLEEPTDRIQIRLRARVADPQRVDKLPPRMYPAAHMREQARPPERAIQPRRPIGLRHPGGLLNPAQLARGLGVDGKTVAAYLDLLVDLLLVCRLPPWHRNVGKRLLRSLKVYARDSGILHALRWTTAFIRPAPTSPPNGDSSSTPGPNGTPSGMTSRRSACWSSEKYCSVCNKKKSE